METDADIKITIHEDNRVGLFDFNVYIKMPIEGFDDDEINCLKHDLINVFSEFYGVGDVEVSLVKNNLRGLQ